jgi:hypothetical protein
MTEPIPSPITALIEATNAGDEDRFVAAFTADARVEDGGRVFLGHVGVARWNLTDNIGVGMHFDLVACVASGEETYDVTLHGTSRRFSGKGTMRLTLKDGRISSLVIG